MEPNRVDPSGELVARGIGGGERRKVGTDVCERHAEARHAGRQRQAGRADARPEIDGAGAGWRGGSEQDGIMPEAMAAARLPQAQAAAENRIVSEIRGGCVRLSFS